MSQQQIPSTQQIKQKLKQKQIGKRTQETKENIN